VILLLLILVAAGLAAYYLWYKPYARDRDAPRTYIFADSVFLRSSKQSGVEYNILDRVFYGSEIITYDNTGEWAEVKAHDKKGFVSSAYLLSKEDFDLLNGVWGDADAKECIATSKCRAAILRYLKKNHLKTGSNGWQIFTMTKEAKNNNVAYPRLYDSNSKFTDFIFVIKDNHSRNRRVVGYSFDDETEKPIFRFVGDAPDSGLITDVKNEGSAIYIYFDNGLYTCIYNW